MNIRKSTPSKYDTGTPFRPEQMYEIESLQNTILEGRPSRNEGTRSSSSKPRGLNGSYWNRVTDSYLPADHVVQMPHSSHCHENLSAAHFPNRHTHLGGQIGVDFLSHICVPNQHTYLGGQIDTDFSVTHLCTWVHVPAGAYVSQGTSPARPPCTWVPRYLLAGLLPKSRHHARDCLAHR